MKSMTIKSLGQRLGRLGLIVGLGAGLALSATVARADMGVATGSSSGTYYAVTKDIQRVCKGVVNMKVYESAGSLSNLERIFSDPNVQYGIVQEDALVYKSLSDPDMMKKIKMVFPFYREELQLVGLAQGPDTLQGFAGKKIVIGNAGSGMWVTGQMIKARGGVNFTPVEMDPQQGLELLAQGKVDGVLIVGGKPFPLLTNLGAFATGRIKMVGISAPGLDSFYHKAMIPEGIYAWQKTPVQTYSVQSVMATYDYKSAGLQKDIYEMVRCVRNNLPELQAHGHPKWREVDPTDMDRVNWPVHPAAKRAMQSK